MNPNKKSIGLTSQKKKTCTKLHIKKNNIHAYLESSAIKRVMWPTQNEICKASKNYKKNALKTKNYSKAQRMRFT